MVQKGMEAAHRVLSGLYTSIGNHSEYDSLFSAFDEFLGDDFDPQTSKENWYDFFRTHFAKANEFFERTHTDVESPQRYVLRQPIATAVLGKNDQIQAQNEQFTKQFGTDTRSLLGDLYTDPAWESIHKLRQGEITGPLLLHIDVGNDQVEIFIATQIDLFDQSLNCSKSYIALRNARSVWLPSIETLLQDVYKLTSAEIDIIRSIFEYGDLKKVAKERGRSIRTVHTQLNSIYDKMNVGGQVKLVVLVASFLQLAGLEEADRRSKAAIQSELDIRSVQLGNRSLSYVQYGSMNGRSVILINTSLPPEMTEPFRNACKRDDLNIIAPFKPGSEGTTARSIDVDPVSLASDYADLLSLCGIEKTIVVGTASGGLYALEFARAYPDRVEGVVLVDTGVPYASLKQIKALPKSMRRTMLIARYMPKLLFAPHRIVAANFKGSLKGEARVVDFFFSDSPVDQKIVETRPEFYQLTRRIINYSFDDVDRLVTDVSAWASDWSDLLREVVDKHQIRFVHGTENTLFPIDKISEFCSGQQKAELFKSRGQGQLQIFLNPNTFTQAIESLIPATARRLSSL
ncbi:MAG: alpha/beta fold hydrolase [Pseudomonadota bacterium]